MSRALVGLGSQQLTVSSTSVALPSIPANAKRVLIRVRGANVFMENDGTAATTCAGIRVDAGSYINGTLEDVSNLIQWRFIREACTDATLDINYYN